MLIAADTNVLMDLAAEVESVVDTLGLVRQRVAGARWVVLPEEESCSETPGC
jgi:hypothetical protein